MYSCHCTPSFCKAFLIKAWLSIILVYLYLYHTGTPEQQYCYLLKSVESVSQQFTLFYISLFNSLPFINSICLQWNVTVVPIFTLPFGILNFIFSIWHSTFGFSSCLSMRRSGPNAGGRGLKRPGCRSTLWTAGGADCCRAQWELEEESHCALTSTLAASSGKARASLTAETDAGRWTDFTWLYSNSSYTFVVLYVICFFFGRSAAEITKIWRLIRLLTYSHRFLLTASHWFSYDYVELVIYSAVFGFFI